MKKHERWSIDTLDLTPDRAEEQPKKESRMRTATKRHWKKILIVVLCTYLVILLFGLFAIRFYYDESGDRRLYPLSFSDFQAQDDYAALKKQLDGIRSLLVDVAIVDVHLANGEYSNYEASTLYTQILDGQLDVLIPKISAMNLKTEREPIREVMESLLSYDLAMYLQRMTEGLKSNDGEIVVEALQYRAQALSTYDTLEADLQSLALSLKLETANYFQWDLYEAASKKDSTAVLKQEAGESDGG